jgi:hypothetical protein
MWDDQIGAHRIGYWPAAAASGPVLIIHDCARWIWQEMATSSRFARPRRSRTGRRARRIGHIPGNSRRCTAVLAGNAPAYCAPQAPVTDRFSGPEPETSCHSCPFQIAQDRCGWTQQGPASPRAPVASRSAVGALWSRPYRGRFPAVQGHSCGQRPRLPRRAGVDSGWTRRSGVEGLSHSWQFQIAQVRSGSKSPGSRATVAGGSAGRAASDRPCPGRPWPANTTAAANALPGCASEAPMTDRFAGPELRVQAAPKIPDCAR